MNGACRFFCPCRLALLFALLAPACRQWDEVSASFVEPLDDFLHHRHRVAWESGQLDEILGLYTVECRALVREPKRVALENFADVDYATSFINDVIQIDGQRKVSAEVLLRVRGVTPSGKRLTLVQTLQMICGVQADGDWQVEAESLIDEDRAYSSAVSFKDEARERGLDFVHTTGGVMDRFGRIQNYSPGSGLAVGDYDSDGDEDIFLVAGKNSQLFQNRGDGTFADVTEKSGLIAREGEARMAVFADYDNDGNVDLFVGRIDAPNLLYRNLGDGRFDDVAEEAGIVPDTKSFETVGACFADFDRDGNLDLYVINSSNLFRHHPEPMRNALNPTPNVMYFSNGDGTFRDVTDWAGVGHSGWGLAVSTVDYDLDGDTDIFIGNDVGFNVLYSNRGDGRFDNLTLESGLFHRGANMSVAWGDVNSDGFPDPFIGAMDSNSRWMVDQPGFPAPASWYVNLILRWRVIEILKEMLHGNRFYLNNGDGTFQELSSACGVRKNGWAWSSLFLDYDNDADLDVYAINGFISGKNSKDL